MFNANYKYYVLKIHIYLMTILRMKKNQMFFASWK